MVAHNGVMHSTHGKTKTHCINGHEYTKESVYLDPRGKRQCRICRSKMVKKWYWTKGTNKHFLPEEERFYSKIKKVNGCWLWQDRLNADGYGAFKPDRKSVV